MRTIVLDWRKEMHLLSCEDFTERTASYGGIRYPFEGRDSKENRHRYLERLLEERTEPDEGDLCVSLMDQRAFDAMMYYRHLARLGEMMMDDDDGGEEDRCPRR